jgi:glutamyl-tRNA synthetase
MKTRFAPSPTGLMHFGNLRTALFSFLLAKQQGGKFVLRIEDTDLVRSEAQYEVALKEDLYWAGITWQEEAKQSDRLDIYAKCYAELIDKKIAYPCFCSDQQLAIERKLQLSQGKPPRYKGTCRNLTAEQIAEKKTAGLEPALRFNVSKVLADGEWLEFIDLIKGKQKFLSKDLGDFIIQRQTGDVTFMFSNSIDDADMGITHALRGEDHLTNTPRQLLILRALGLEIKAPQYGHFSLINGSDGAKLSKRNGSEAVRDLKQQGYHPLALANYFARLGHTIAKQNFLTMDELAANFSLDNIGTSSSTYDKMHLQHWQKEAILHASNDEIWHMIDVKVKDLVPQDKQAEFVSIAKENILMPSEANALATMFFAEQLDYTEENKGIIKAAGKDFFEHAISFISANQDKTFTFQELADYIKNQTGCKGKQLFLPLRVCLTNQLAGPEMAKFINIMPKEILSLRFNTCLGFN